MCGENIANIQSRGVPAGRDKSLSGAGRCLAMAGQPDDVLAPARRRQWRRCSSDLPGLSDARARKVAPGDHVRARCASATLQVQEHMPEPEASTAEGSSGQPPGASWPGCRGLPRSRRGRHCRAASQTSSLRRARPERCLGCSAGTWPVQAGSLMLTRAGSGGRPCGRCARVAATHGAFRDERGD